MKTIKLLFGFFALIFASMSNAAIISYGTYTHDDTTDIVVGDGLEWLQWDRTLNHSIKSIQGQLDTIDGGGWSIASNAQMASLFNNFGFGGITWDAEETTAQFVRPWSDDLANAPETYFGHMFGNTTSDDGLSIGAYFGLDLNNNSLYNFALVEYQPIEPDAGYFISTITADNRYYRQRLYDNGIALVRTMSIPEPSIIALFAAGLFGIALTRRRRS